MGQNEIQPIDRVSIALQRGYCLRIAFRVKNFQAPLKRLIAVGVAKLPLAGSVLDLLRCR
jgi:hypothetical protein